MLKIVKFVLFIALKLFTAVNSGKKGKFELNMYRKTVPIAIGMILIASLLATIQTIAQTTTNGKSNEVMAGITIPVGEFSKTHVAGISLGYSWSHHRFGHLEAVPKKTIGFTANGSVDYYFGKKEIVGGYTYHYGGYLYLHAFGGIICNPGKKVNISVSGGPTMGIYKGSADIGFGLIVNGSYYLTNAISITPAVIFLKHNNANALWVIAIKAGYCF